MASWLFVLALTLVAFHRSGLEDLFVPALVAGYAAVAWTIVKETRRWSDWLHPLLLIVFAGTFRFALPGVFDLREHYFYRFVPPEAWTDAQVIWMVGLLGLVAAWIFTPSGWSLPAIRVPLTRGVGDIALYGLVFGAGGLLLFILANASFGVVLTGEFRGTEIQEGTGWYFYLSLLLTPSSLILVAYLRSRGVSAVRSVLPALLASGLFFLLGGRVRSLLPMLGAGLLLWYDGHRPRRSGGAAFAWLLLGAIFATAFALAGLVYRSGLGFSGILDYLSPTEIWNYAGIAILTDLGQIHGLAGAAAFPPGTLGGQTFSKLIWPLSDWLRLPGKSASIFIVQQLIGFDGNKWGVHPSLVGDAYLNFGFWGAFATTFVFGVLLKFLYDGFRSGRIGLPLYVLVFIFMLRIFVETVEKFPETTIVVIYLLVLGYLGRVVPELVPPAREDVLAASAPE